MAIGISTWVSCQSSPEVDRVGAGTYDDTPYASASASFNKIKIVEHEYAIVKSGARYSVIDSTPVTTCIVVVLYDDQFAAMAHFNVASDFGSTLACMYEELSALGAHSEELQSVMAIGDRSNPYVTDLGGGEEINFTGSDQLRSALHEALKKRGTQPAELSLPRRTFLEFHSTERTSRTYLDDYSSPNYMRHYVDLYRSINKDRATPLLRSHLSLVPSPPLNCARTYQPEE